MFAEHGNTSSQNQDVSLCFSLGIDGSSRREKDEMCQHGTSYQSKSTLDQSEPSEPSLSGQVDPDRQKSMPTYPFGLHSTCGIEAWCGNTWAVPSGESLTNTHQVCLPYDLHLSRLQRLSLTAYNALGNPPESMLHIYQNLHGLLGPLILHWFLLFSIIHLQCQNISPWIFGKTCFCPLVLQKSWQKTISYHYHLCLFHWLTIGMGLRKIPPEMIQSSGASSRPLLHPMRSADRIHVGYRIDTGW